MPKTKKSIVFCHGLWADGSCFSKLIIPLQAEAYECIATQHGLNTTAEDVAVTKETIGRVSSPVILVGHSYRIRPRCCATFWSLLSPFFDNGAYSRLADS